MELLCRTSQAGGRPVDVYQMGSVSQALVEKQAMNAEQQMCNVQKDIYVGSHAKGYPEIP